MGRLLTGALLVACLSLPAGQASAHAVLSSSTPANGAKLEQAPTRVEVRFNEPVDAEFTPLVVKDRTGARVDLGDARVHPADPSVVMVSLKQPLPTGFYTVTYRITSLDGHPVQGALAFTVGDAVATEPSATADQGMPAVPVPVSVVHGLTQALALALAGLTAFLVLVWWPVAGLAGANRLGPWAAGLALLLILLGVAEVGLYATRASGEPFSLALLLQAFTRTRVGGLWLWRALVASAAAAALAGAGRSRGLSRWLALLPGAALLGTYSMQSHAMATGQTLPVVADWVHLLAAAPWVGGLVGFGLVIWPWLRDKPADERDQLLARVVPRFSKVAVTAVLLLTVTGLYSATLHIPTIDALWTTAYGRSLAIKLALLLPLLGLGGYNLLRKGSGSFRRAVRVEVVLMAGVLLAAGFLTSMPPANVELASRQGPFQEQTTLAGFALGLRIEPARVGFNQALIDVHLADGTPVKDAGVGLRLSMIEHDMGLQNIDAKEQAAGTYHADQLVLGMHGDWQVEVVVLTKEGREVRHTFLVKVPAPIGQ